MPHHDSPTVPAAAELARRFETPDARHYGPVPIWWWSGATLTRERLRWQMEQLISQGVAQAVVINLAPTGPLYGSLADDPPFMSEKWWEIFLGACDDADELGFSIWPYDQIGFSGANLQGRLITAHPEWAGQALGRLQLQLDSASAEGAPQRLTAPLGAVPLAAYLVAPDGLSSTAVPIDGTGAAVEHGDGTLTLVYTQIRGFDYFDRAAGEALIDTVHGEFSRRAGQWFGTVIAGFFQDELPAMPTWSASFAETFAERAGYRLEPRLAALWNDPVPADALAGGEAEAVAQDVRRRFQEHRTALADEAFFGPLSTWFEEHGLICGFDQQSPAREGDPVAATSLYGNYLELHAGYGAPGSDHWGDSKVHSSLAHAGDHPRTWIESFHSSGWGGTLEETYDWLAPFLRRGATLYNPHAVYYSTSGGWWEWAPPSTCWRQPYWGQYHVLSDSVSRLAQLFTTGDHVADTVLVFPTSTVQSNITLDAPLPAAERAGEIYHRLNGTPAWYAERPGILDISGHDYDIFDETVLGAASVVGGELLVGRERYRSVVLPGTTVLRADAAARLVELAAGGGRVIFVGELPASIVDPTGAAPHAAAVARSLHELVASGAVSVVEEPEQVPALLSAHPVHVEADVPVLVRRVGDTWVIALFAHDGTSGTDQPIIKGGGSGIEWIETTWDAYWSEITERGYEFRPVTGRRASVTVHGLPGLGVQQWDPRTGERQRVGTTGDSRSATFDIAFTEGTVALLVVSDSLPEPTRRALGPVQAQTHLDQWDLTARSSLDNRHGDFADARRTGILPLEVWEFEHRERTAEGEGEPTTVTATFGPFADVLGPGSVDGETPWSDVVDGWSPASWSLSRGIEQDPVHGDSLGPKGYVPEEFLAWPEVRTGDWVAAATSIVVPDDVSGAVLAVGANAVKHILIDGAPVASSGQGYLATAPIGPGRHAVQLWLRSERDERIRASFAVVTDLATFRRPEWLEPVDRSEEPTTWVVEHRIDIEEAPHDCRILVGSERPCIVEVNGVEIGRQSDFDPYADRRFGRLHPYDLRGLLVTGANTIRLSSLEGGRRPAVLVDSLPVGAGGLGIATGVGEWSSGREGVAIPLRMRSQQWQDPRFVSIEAKPHPLPRARWLELPHHGDGIVLDLVPDRDPADHAEQVLRFTPPVGATAVTVPTELDFFAERDGLRLDPDTGTIVLDPPATGEETLDLVFERPGGRRAGAVLDAAVQVQTTTVSGPLRDWTELGLSAAAGEVEYTTVMTSAEVPPGEGRLVLDLGRVRGSVEVRVGGVHAGHLAWSPYRLDVTDAFAAAEAADPAAPVEVSVRVMNTLAGYFDHASPTPGVFAGQRAAGLYGPVHLARHGD